MIITIDGPAGSGKSTIAKRLSHHFHGVFLDTGAMYRSVTLIAMEDDVDLEDEDAVCAVAEAIDIAFEDTDSGQRVFIDHEDRTADIRTREVDANVSLVSSYASVRSAMVDLQRVIGHEAKIAVVEGRDTGSVVFPDADKKFYLEGDPVVRAQRRAAERGETLDEAIISEIIERDRKDTTRDASPLIVPSGAQIIDTTHLTIDEVLEKIIESCA